MNYSPDYSMRRKNQDCGCSRNITWEYESRQTPRKPEYIHLERAHSSDCGCTKAECTIEKKVPGEHCCNKEMRIMDCMDTFPVGMTYTPWQVWQELYEIDKALHVGTIFRELDYPWEVGRCAKCR